MLFPRITPINIRLLGQQLQASIAASQDHPVCATCKEPIKLFNSDDYDSLRCVGGKPVHDACWQSNVGEAMLTDTLKL